MQRFATALQSRRGKLLALLWSGGFVVAFRCCGRLICSTFHFGLGVTGTNQEICLCNLGPIKNHVGCNLDDSRSHVHFQKLQAPMLKIKNLIAMKVEDEKSSFTILKSF